MKNWIIATMVASLLVVPMVPASANEDDVRRNGSCSGSTDWKLKMSPENGRIEVEFEVDQNRTGHEWRVVMKHDGDVFFRGTRTTAGRSGSFEVREVTNNSNGTDNFVAKARNPQTDEVCRGTGSF
jgi:hypothetical protein